MKNANKLLNWSSVMSNILPPMYNFKKIDAVGIWCAFNECFGQSKTSPYTHTLLEQSSTSWIQYLENDVGFILIANNPALNGMNLSLCPPAGYRIFRFNDCKSTWPLPSSSDIIVQRATGNRNIHDYSGIAQNGSLLCSLAFNSFQFNIRFRLGRKHLAPSILQNATLSASNHDDDDNTPQDLPNNPLLEEIWRLPKNNSLDSKRRLTFSSGTTLILLLRHAFPTRPILAFGFTFHREYPCKMLTSSDCPQFTHNYSIERLFISTVPHLHLLQTTSEILHFLLGRDDDDTNNSTFSSWRSISPSSSSCPSS